jgi:hypothetical protein
MMWITGKTNSQNRLRKKSFGGTFCFSNCPLDTGGLVFLVSEFALDLGRLAPASEVAGGYTIPFKNWQTMPFLKW